MADFTPDSIIAVAAAVRDHANTFIFSALSERGIHDLLPAHGAALHALFIKSPMQMGELAKAIGRKKNTVTGLINTLEERGYCHREPDPSDARAQQVVLTAKGERVRAEQAAVSALLLDTVWQGVDEEDQRICMQTLKTILENLRGKDSD